MSSTQTSLDLPVEGGPGLVGPISQDPDYPELIRDLAETVRVELIGAELTEAQATAVAETVAEHVREKYGGQNLYWAKGETMRIRRKRAAMWHEFDGANHRDLAHRYGMSLPAVYRALNVAKKEFQGQRDIFNAGG